MGKIEVATQWMIDLANDNSHGYDQDNRWGPDYDCSAAVITAWETAGVPVKSNGAYATSSMKNGFLKSGFEEVISSVDVKTGSGLKYGDVLLKPGSHTAMYIGNKQLVHASINENGTAHGGKPGDQTGKEICVRSYYNHPWTSVLRYTKEGGSGGDSGSSGKWIQDPTTKKWWYRHDDGSYTKNNWELIDGKWYYFDGQGWMCTGWILINGKWYYLQSDGALVTNAWIEKLYYVGSDGAMYVNSMTPDGYIVDGSGKWDGREAWVKRLQIALKNAGHTPGTIDGIAGSSTLAACPTLQYGNSGELVTLLQERLYYFFHISISGGIDGSFGDGTKTAVITFQKQKGLSADGVVGTNTWRKLLSL